MENVFSRWMHKRKTETKTVTLDDVTPLHPTGMQEGPDGF